MRTNNKRRLRNAAFIMTPLALLVGLAASTVQAEDYFSSGVSCEPINPTTASYDYTTSGRIRNLHATDWLQVMCDFTHTRETNFTNQAVSVRVYDGNNDSTDGQFACQGYSSNWTQSSYDWTTVGYSSGGINGTFTGTFTVAPGNLYVYGGGSMLIYCKVPNDDIADSYILNVWIR